MRKTKLVPRVDSYPQRVNHMLLSHVKQYAGSGNGSPSLRLSPQPCIAEGETTGVVTQQSWPRSGAREALEQKAFKVKEGEVWVLGVP